MPDAQPLYMFEITSDVRDYECDMQGIVNNAVYLNYLEHARHEFIRERGVVFARLIKRGIQPVMAEMNIRYLKSLVSNDRYTVRLTMSHANGLVVFKGDIYRTTDEALCIKSTAKIAILQDGQLIVGGPIEKLIARLA
jgi:acyl-CoA thioester hydrolase